jgi:hypothetical protein
VRARHEGAARAALVVAGVVAAFLLAELGLRVATGTLGLWGDPDVVDPMVGYMLQPGLSLLNPGGGSTSP